MTWQLVSPEPVIHKRASLKPYVALEATICHFHCTLLATAVSHSPGARGIYTDMAARKGSVTGVLLKTGYDTELIASTINNNHIHQRNNYNLYAVLQRKTYRSIRSSKERI